MPKINDGGYAFPTNSGLTYKGMSLRAYFAGQALAGLMASEGSDGTRWDLLAQNAVFAADALIAELAKDTTS